MASASHRSLGFTLIELAVVLTVVVVLAMLALPSFSSFRQRSAMRTAAEQTVSFWNQARFEAAKRNSMVKVSVSGSGSAFCLGANTTTNSADNTACDCTAANSCDVGVFPGSSGEWNSVKLSGTPTIGSSTNGVVVIEPKRTELTDSGMAGTISLAGPPGPYQYKLNVVIDRFGRANICESSTASAHMSDYFPGRVCSP